MRIVTRECPFCGCRSRSFLPNVRNEPGASTATNLKISTDSAWRFEWCPECFSDANERLLYLYLLHRTKLFDPTAPRVRFLCMTESVRIESMARKVSRVTLERTSADNFSAESGAGHALRASNRKFDLFLLDRSLERCENAQALMEQLGDLADSPVRILILAATSPSLPSTLSDEDTGDEKKRMRSYGGSQRRRIFGQDLPQWLSDFGYGVTSFTWRRGGQRFGSPVNRYALPPRGVIYELRRDRSRSSGTNRAPAIR